MRRSFQIIFILVLSSVANPLFSQKVAVTLKSQCASGFSYWRITDEDQNLVTSTIDHQGEDSVSFSLEANRFYSLWISVAEQGGSIYTCYTLGINGENILAIMQELEPGDHEYKFFTGTRSTGTKIIGGTDASIAGFPWQVYYRSGNYLCGGTIIDPSWIMTACHCTFDSNHNAITADQMYIIAGTATPTSQNAGTKYNVSQVFRHPGYDAGTYLNDIALLQLTTPITVSGTSAPIRPLSAIDVADGDIAPGVMAWVTGWGLTSVTPQILPGNLQKVQLPIVSIDVASVVWSSIPSTDIMAGYRNGTKDACNGDSGGPFVVPVTGEFKVAGIISWGNVTCSTYGAYTDVSQFIDWINGTAGTIDFRPSAPAGNSVICNTADTAVYNVEPYSGGSNYTWELYPSNSGTVIPNSLQAKVVWNQSFSGQAYVMVNTTAGGRVSDWAKLKVQIATSRNITSVTKDTSICANRGILLTVNATGYDLHYKWYKDNNLLPSYTSGSLSIASATPSNSGVYRCDVSNPCGTTPSDSINLNVMRLTSISGISKDTNIPIGRDSTIQVNSSGTNLSFQWAKDGIAIAGGTDSVLTLDNVTAENIGTYRVTVTGTCGTRTSDTIYVFIRNKESVGTIDALVWPTVSHEELQVALSNDESYTIQMIDFTGSLIRQIENCRFQTTIYVSDLPDATYILRIFNSHFRKTIRVIKI